MNADALKTFFLNKTNVRILAVLLAIVAVFVVVISTGFYYAATVNGDAITARAFFRTYRAFATYADNLGKTYAARGATSSPAMPEDREIKALALTELVERALVHEGARAEAGSDLAELVAGKIAKYAHDEGLKNAAQTLYGLSLEGYAQEVLVPQAERDILAARLFLKGKKFDAWLREAKQSARVSIFSKNFVWDGDAGLVRSR